MKLRFRILLAIILYLQTPLIAFDGTDTIEEFSVKGVKVLLKPSAANDIISVQFYIKGGCMNLTEDTQGIEQFAFRSTILKDAKYREEGWDKIFSGVGARLGSAATKDFTLVGLSCVREYFDKLWEVYTDRIVKAFFYDERVEVVRNQMLTEAHQRKDSPDAYVNELAEKFFYRGHPYELNPNGTEESIKKIKMRQLDSHLEKHLKKVKSLLVVVGNITKEELKDKVADTFGKLSKGKPKDITLPDRVKHDKANLKIEARKLPTNYILGLFSAPSMREADYHAMVMAVEILNSRLWQEVRTKRNLSYAPLAALGESLANSGRIYASSDQPDSTLQIMLAEMQKLKDEPVSTAELQRRLSTYLTDYYLRNESNASQGQFLASLELAGLGWQHGDQMVEELRAVTPADIQRVAQEYFKNIQFVYLGDPALIKKELFTSM